MRSMALQRHTIAQHAQVRHHQAKAQRSKTFKCGEAQHTHRRVKRIKAAGMVRNRVRPLEHRRNPQLRSQLQNVPVAAENMMVILLQRPIPMRTAKAGCQPANFRAAFKYSYAVAGARKVVSCRQPRHTRANDGDLHESWLPRRSRTCAQLRLSRPK